MQVSNEEENAKSSLFVFSLFICVYIYIRDGQNEINHSIHCFFSIIFSSLPYLYTGKKNEILSIFDALVKVGKESRREKHKHKHIITMYFFSLYDCNLPLTGRFR